MELDKEKKTKRRLLRQERWLFSKAKDIWTDKKAAREELEITRGN